MNGAEAAKAQAEYAPGPSGREEELSEKRIRFSDSVSTENNTDTPVTSHQRILARDCCDGLPVVVDCPDAGHYVHPQGRAMRVKSVGCNPAHTKQDSANCKATIDSSLPSDAAARKSIPMCTGLLDYFPDALSAVAACSKAGNDQHNPGQPLHWARGKSTDQADCIVRHLMERGKIDTDGVRHSAKVAWRSLALLQLEIEADRNTSK